MAALVRAMPLAASAAIMISPPLPPQASGMARPVKPCSPSFRHKPAGKASSRSISAICGRISFCPNASALSYASWCSSESSKSIHILPFSFFRVTRIARATLSSCIMRFPLLHEGNDAFVVVVRDDSYTLQVAFELQRGLQVNLEGRVHKLLDETVGERRPAGQAFGERLDRCLEFAERHAAIDQSNALGLRASHLVGQHHQLQRLAHPDEARQEVAAAAVRHDADARENLDET